VSNRIKADGITGRDLLGCAVAAAVSASFNAPIAGALFALEVVLRHFALHAFAPHRDRQRGGHRHQPAGLRRRDRVRPAGEGLAFYVELPAFLLLGAGLRLVAVVLMRRSSGPTIWHRVQQRTGLPRWLRPAWRG
jgi:CIC family chloride channel protein